MNAEETLENKMTALKYAKKAVQSELNDANCSVDFRGLTYWAGEVERLRKEIKALL